MCSIIRTIALSAVIIAGMAGSVFGQDDDNKSDKKKASEVVEQLKETSHEVTIDGAKVAYKATAGTIALTVDNEDPKASIFYIAYTVDNKTDVSDRPITFSFNGGPGSSSVWLHLGLLGPRRVYLDDDGNATGPPYRLVDNEFSLLDKTDLVFIDPVSTGYSRAAEGEDAGQFHGLNEDIEAVGEFIRLYLTRNKRWSSPKFLIGESYGTTRAAGLASYLQDSHGMFLNGVMLISSILNFQTARFSDGNDLPFVLFLPTYTATAWYHQKLEPSLQADLGEALRQSEQFAAGEYASALLAGDALSDAKRQSIIAELARLTGLSPEYVDQTNLRIYIWRFVKELLRDQKRSVGRLDSRFKGMDRDYAGEGYDYDPSYSNILGSYSGTLNDYVRRELEYESNLPYEILTGNVYPWSYKQFQNRFVNTAEDLREAMTQNPHLKLFVASGYFDLATPYFATDYTLNHLGLDPSLRDNVTVSYFEAGHMMYIHLPSLASLRGDLVNFVESSK